MNVILWNGINELLLPTNMLLYIYNYIYIYMYYTSIGIIKNKYFIKEIII